MKNKNEHLFNGVFLVFQKKLRFKNLFINSLKLNFFLFFFTIKNPVTFNQEESKFSEPVNTLDYNTITDSGYIPNPPEIPSEDIIINALGEPTLQSIGLGCISTPTGWVQLILEFLHINCDLSWYTSIIVYTIVIRTLMMPISMGTLRFSAKMRIIGPQMVALKEKVSEAIKNGDHRESKLLLIPIRKEEFFLFSSS